MSNCLIINQSGKKYSIEKNLAKRCELFNSFFDDLTLHEEYPFELIYKFLHDEDLTFDYSFFRVENYYQYESFFNWLIRQMSQNFDLTKIQSLEPYLQKELSRYLSYQLTKGISYHKLLSLNLKFFQSEEWIIEFFFDHKDEIKDVINNIIYEYG